MLQSFGVNFSEPICHCTGSGDVHYHLFDGPWTDFQGVCTYILAQTTNDLEDDLPEFVVAVNSRKINHHDTVSFVDETYVAVYGYDIVLNSNTQIQVHAYEWGPIVVMAIYPNLPLDLYLPPTK